MSVDGRRVTGLKKRLVVHGKQVQLDRLQKAFPERGDANEQEALARGLIGCRTAWGIARPLINTFIAVALALQPTVGAQPGPSRPMR